MTFLHRQQRLRVLEALERRARQFRTDEELYPLRVPRDPLPLADVIEEALAGEDSRFDPATLRSRTLLDLTWQDGSRWEAWVIVLPSGLKLFCASGEEAPHVLASGGRHANTETDRQFLELLSESAGDRFGIEMHGGAPSRVRSFIEDRDFLADVFVNLFEVTGTEQSVRDDLARRASGSAPPASADFRNDVVRWLDAALGPA